MFYLQVFIFKISPKISSKEKISYNLSLHSFDPEKQAIEGKVTFPEEVVEIAENDQLPIVIIAIKNGKHFFKDQKTSFMVFYSFLFEKIKKCFIALKKQYQIVRNILVLFVFKNTFIQCDS